MKPKFLLSAILGIFLYLNISLLITIIRQIVELILLQFSSMTIIALVVMVMVSVLTNLTIVLTLRHYILKENLHITLDIKNFRNIIISFFILSILKTGLNIIKPFILNTKNNIPIINDTYNHAFVNQIIDIMNYFTLIICLIVIGYIMIKRSKKEYNVPA